MAGPVAYLPDSIPRPGQGINLDTSAAIGLITEQSSSLPERLQVERLIDGRFAYLTDAARNELERICGDGNGMQTRNGFCGPTERDNLDRLLLQRVLPLTNNPSTRIASVPPRSGNKNKNDPVDVLIFGTGDRQRLATATYDSRFPRYLQRLGIDMDYVDLLVSGAQPPQLGGL